MNSVEKLDKITEEIDEIIGISHIKEILNERDLKIYWGTTPGRLPNILYLIPLMTLYHFIDCKCEIKILLADIHAYLDSIKSDFDVLKARTNIHEKIIKMLLSKMNIESSQVEFIQGTSYQLRNEFTLDLYKINSFCSVSQVKNAGREAVIQETDPKMTSLLYPTLQALDIEYLECDVFFGDLKQKNICKFTNQILEKLGYRKRGFFLNEIYEELNIFKSITFIDTYVQIENKINNIKLNLLIEFIDVIIFDFCKISGIAYMINNIQIHSIEEIKESYKNKDITNKDIRKSVVDFIDLINESIREEYSHDDSISLLRDAKYIP